MYCSRLLTFSRCSFLICSHLAGAELPFAYGYQFTDLIRIWVHLDFLLCAHTSMGMYNSTSDSALPWACTSQLVYSHNFEAVWYSQNVWHQQLCLFLFVCEHKCSLQHSVFIGPYHASFTEIKWQILQPSLAHTLIALKSSQSLEFKVCAIYSYELSWFWIVTTFLSMTLNTGHIFVIFV